MHKVIEQASLVAAIALAALPIVALGTAHAQPVAIKVSDLNLGQDARSVTLAQRIDAASHKVCASAVFARDLGRMAVCEKAVRSEAMDQVAIREAASGRIQVAAR